MISPPAAVVVNDDTTQLNILAGLLRKAGLAPQAFSDAEAALQFMLETAPPALIVTDLYMPKLDGWRFCRLLRSAEYATLNAVPIMVVSATFTGEESHRITESLGANLFMSMPVDGPLFINQAQTLAAGEVSQIRPRALILEDSSTLAGLLRKALAGQGYQPDTATSLADGLRMVEQATYDLAVLDYHLPDGQGDQVLERLHADQPNCVCIMITSDPQPHLALDWMKRGAAAYLRKPFAMDYMLEVVERTRRERALLRVEDLLEARTRELRESEDRYKSIVEKSFAGVYVIQNGRFVFINANAAAFAEYRSEELMGKRSDSIIHPEDRAEIRKKARSRLVSENPLPCEYRIVTKRGQIRWIMETLSIIQFNGKPAILGNSMDITDRMQAEEALKASEMRFEGVLRNVAAVAVQGYGMDGTVRYWNPASETLYGYTAEEALGRNLLDLIIPPPMRDEVRALIRRMAETGNGIPAAEHHEHQLMRKDGSFVQVYSSHVIVQVPGQDTELFCLDIDISEWKQAEQERERLQARLHQAQKMESVGNLASGVAHDFNNLLQAMSGNIQLLLMKNRKNDDPDTKRLTNIATIIDRAARLIRQLLLFSRKAVTEKQRLDLNQAVKETVRLLERTVPKMVAIELGLEDVQFIMADPVQVEQVLLNLAINAADAMPEGGRLRIETQNVYLDAEFASTHQGITPGPHVLLRVSDTGRGMDKATLSQIFDPFFTTKEAGKGTGLGLATVYGIVVSHGGKVLCYSEPDQGTCFNIYWPAVQEPDAEQYIFPPETISPVPAILNGAETILVTDDDPDILELTRKALADFGYTILSASSGEEALAIYAKKKAAIGMVILDLNMPGMGGRRCLQELLRIDPQVRVIIASGYASDVLFRTIREEGAAGFISKPYQWKALATAVRKVLDPGHVPLNPE